MSWLSPYRWLLVGGLAIALWGWHWNDKRIAVSDAIAVMQAKQVAAALAASEAARAKEAELQSKVTKVANDYQTEKKRRAADAVSLNDSLRQLQASIDSPTSTSASSPGRVNGTGGLERELLGNCSKALAEMAITADRLEGKVVGLQGYINSVMLPK